MKEILYKIMFSIGIALAFLIISIFICLLLLTMFAYVPVQYLVIIGFIIIVSAIYFFCD